ncbi:MAG: hypothetical protein WKF54_05580 [Nocardioidaceae bacterium]
MTLADTPTTWSEGPPLSTLNALLIFAGIPLLVILVVSLLVFAPSWVNGPRYRPGQPWDARSEWFGGAVPAQPPAGMIEVAGRSGADDDSSARPSRRADEGSGGASAGW